VKGAVVRSEYHNAASDDFVESVMEIVKAIPAGKVM
jgi:hypothetical protein